MNESVLEEKSSFKTLGLSFSSKLVWVSYNVSIAKIESKTNGFLFRSIKSLSTKVGLYLYKFIIRSCKENCSRIWAGAPSCYLDMLDEQRNGYVGLLVFHLVLFFEPFAKCNQL